MWGTLIATFVVFIVFGLRVEYEEDISRILPAPDEDSTCSLAFGNLKVKDKIFVQMRSAGREDLDSETLAVYMEEFVDSLSAHDAGTGYIEGVLSHIDDDVMLNALDYAMSNMPVLVDESCYEAFDSLLAPSVVAQQMKTNARMVEDDMTGSVTTMVGSDPANLRGVILGTFLGDSVLGSGADFDGGAGFGGFTLVNGQIFCADGTVALAFLSPHFGSLNSKIGIKLAKLLEAEINDFTESHPDVEILFHGNPAQSVYNSRRIKKDLFWTMSISMLLICLLICICFRNKSTLLLLLFPVVYGAFFALACVDWISGGMSFVVLGLGTLILGVALSYCIHVLTHYKYVSDPALVLRDQATPVILGCLTTIGAFAGLLFTQSSMLRDFGMFASLAMIGTTLCALIFVPHFFSSENNLRSEKAFSIIDKISSYPLDRQTWLLVLIAVVCVVCFFTQSRATFDSELRHISYNEPKIMESKELYSEKNDDGYFSMYYGAVAPTLDEALVCNRALVGVLDSLEGAGVVKRYTNMASLFLPESEGVARIDAWKSYWSGERLASVKKVISRAAEAEGLNPAMFETFYTMAEADYEFESLYYAGVLPDELLCNYIEETEDGLFMVFTPALMSEEDKMIVNDAIAACPGAIVVDPFYYTNDMVRVLNDDFNLILNVSVLLVFVVLLLSFRSLALAIIAFGPMGLSWFVVKGVMGIFGIQFNLINIIISTFVFGIGVDYSIFVMKGLLAQASGKGENLLKYHKTAIFFSAFALIVVTVSLLFAVHPAIRSIGVSTLIGMVSTILIAYTVQPFLFRQLMRVGYFRRRFSRGDGVGS